MFYSTIEKVPQMDIMNVRYEELNQTISGLKNTGVPLITYDGTNFGPSGCGDDIGSYYFIPKLSVIFNLSLDSSITLFYTGIVMLSFIIGAIGFWNYSKTNVGKWISLFTLVLLSVMLISYGDIYVAFGCTAMALIPWCLYLWRRNQFRNILIYCLIAGFIIGISNFIRAFSGLSILIFIVLIAIFSKQFLLKQKIIIISTLLIGVITIQLYSGHLVKSRNDYLISKNVSELILGRHAFWHNIYIGLGFLNNKYDIKYSDSYGGEKVYSMSPDATYGSEEWNSILRSEVFKIAKNDPAFILRQVFAKLGVCLMYVLIFANLGLLFSFFYPKGWKLELVFALCLLINALPGILVMPRFSYLFGLITLAAIYGVVSIDHGLHVRHNKFENSLAHP